MNDSQARERVVAAVRVSRADVASAKAFVAGRRDGDPRQFLAEWLEANGVTASVTVCLVAPDVEAELARAARMLSVSIALCDAVLELVRDGHLRSVGGEWDWQGSVRWTTVPPGGGSGSSSGWSFGEYLMRLPGRLTRPVWDVRESMLCDGDLLVREVNVADLHPGVARALIEAARCLRHEMFLPAVAMLGSASEGAWIELGKALVTVSPGDVKSAKLRDLLESPTHGIAAKISEILELYDRRDLMRAIWSRSMKDQLKGVALWSDLVRDGRNALHWGADASVPNTYEKVATLMLGAIPAIRLLHEVRDAARAASSSR